MSARDLSPATCRGDDSSLRSDAIDSVIGWRVKDYADGWIYCITAEEALREVAEMGGALLEPVFSDAEAQP